MPTRKLTAYGPSIVVLITAAVVLIGGPQAVRSITFAHTSARIIQASERLAQEDNILGQINQAYRDIAAAVEPTVVHISAKRPGMPTARGSRLSLSSGSGWIYDEDGHIVTNYHVIEGAEEIDIQLHSGQTRRATIVGFDRTTDIALLKIPAGRLHAALRADPADEVRQGDLVFAFGSPFDFRFSMSSGVVSGKGRFVGVIRHQVGPGEIGYENFIQVDAAINPGNSGGPLTDYRGRVIGMNTAIATASPRRSQDGRMIDDAQFGGVGLAIPLDMIEPVVTQLIETGEVQKGFLGITIADRSQSVAHELREMGFYESGVPIARVDPRLEPLHEMLRPGDVVTHVGNFSVGTAEQLLLRAAPAEGRISELTVWRFDHERGRGMPFVARLDAAAAAMLGDVAFLRDQDLVARRLEQLGFHGNGVPIANVHPAGPAHGAGLRSFDVITHVNNQPVATHRQLQSIISSLRPGQTANVRVWRHDAQRDRGESIDFEVVLDRFESPLAARMPVISPDPLIIERLGIERMATATPERLGELGQSFQRGVLIEAIAPGSPMDGRVPVGSVIVRVGDRPVRSQEEFIEALMRVRADLRGAPIAYRDPEGNMTTWRFE